jgi:hypothetical protein
MQIPYVGILRTELFDTVSFNMTLEAAHEKRTKTPTAFVTVGES